MDSTVQRAADVETKDWTPTMFRKFVAPLLAGHPPPWEGWPEAGEGVLEVWKEEPVGDAKSGRPLPDMWTSTAVLVKNTQAAIAKQEGGQEVNK